MSLIDELLGRPITTMRDEFSEVLEHYGTKGMKWGVRKRDVPRQGPSQDAQAAHRSLIKAKVNGPQALTNQQLKAVNERLNLEQSYQRLSYTPSKAKMIMDTIFGAGKNVNDAITFANSPAGLGLHAAMTAPTGGRKSAATKAVSKAAQAAAKAAAEAGK